MTSGSAAAPMNAASTRIAIQPSSKVVGATTFSPRASKAMARL